MEDSQVAKVLTAAGTLTSAAGRQGLRELASSVNASPFAFHRRFRTTTGLPPDAFGVRSRLHRAAAALITTTASISAIAFDCGFESCEGFSRAFRQRFGSSPSKFRRLALAPANTCHLHANALVSVGNCGGLHRVSLRGTAKMTVEVTYEYLPEVRLLVARRETPYNALALAIGESLSLVSQYAIKHGVTLTSPPTVRYPTVTMGTITLEAGFAIAAAPEDELAGEVCLVMVNAGPCAIAVHAGAYDDLRDTYGELAGVIRATGRSPVDAPREVYLTDPGDYPNALDWRTQIIQPVDRL